MTTLKAQHRPFPEGASPAIQVIHLVYWQSKLSRSALGVACAQALRLVIEAKLEFNLDDFALIEKSYNPRGQGGYSVLGSGTEEIYRFAVQHGNTSAAVAFEKWVGRKPYWFVRVQDGETSHRRVTVHDKMLVDGRVLKVTSITPEHVRCVAPDNTRPKFTHDELAAIFPRSKKQKPACGDDDSLDPNDLVPGGIDR